MEWVDEEERSQQSPEDCDEETLVISVKLDNRHDDASTTEGGVVMECYEIEEEDTEPETGDVLLECNEIENSDSEGDRRQTHSSPADRSVPYDESGSYSKDSVGIIPYARTYRDAVVDEPNASRDAVYSMRQELYSAPNVRREATSARTQSPHSLRERDYDNVRHRVPSSEASRETFPRGRRVEFPPHRGNAPLIREQLSSPHAPHPADYVRSLSSEIDRHIYNAFQDFDGEIEAAKTSRDYLRKEAELSQSGAAAAYYAHDKVCSDKQCLTHKYYFYASQNVDSMGRKLTNQTRPAHSRYHPQPNGTPLPITSPPFSGSASKTSSHGMPVCVGSICSNKKCNPGTASTKPNDIPTTSVDNPSPVYYGNHIPPGSLYGAAHSGRLRALLEAHHASEVARRSKDPNIPKRRPQSPIHVPMVDKAETDINNRPMKTSASAEDISRKWPWPHDMNQYRDVSADGQLYYPPDAWKKKYSQLGKLLQQPYYDQPPAFENHQPPHGNEKRPYHKYHSQNCPIYAGKKCTGCRAMMEYAQCSRLKSSVTTGHAKDVTLKDDGHRGGGSPPVEEEDKNGRFVIMPITIHITFSRSSI